MYSNFINCLQPGRGDARLTVDGDALVGVVSALQGDGRDGGRVASDDLHLGNIGV